MSTLIECGASPFIPGFALKDVRLENGLTVRVAIGGSGSPLVLLHGHPQNHTTWRKIIQSFCRICVAMATAINQRAIRRTVPIQSAPWRRISSC